MTGFWLVSYIVLWIVVGILCFLVLGMLQQLGEIQVQFVQREAEQSQHGLLPHPAPEHDGPALGSSLQQYTLESMNGFGSMTLSLGPHEKYCLLVFLSPLCETCQYLVGPLNKLARESKGSGKIIGIMRSDKQACNAFISIFPFDIPVVCDSERSITMGFKVHHAPFALLYNESEVLAKKGGIKRPDDLFTLFEDISFSEPLSSKIGNQIP